MQSCGTRTGGGGVGWHVEETPQHQQDRQPRNVGFQGLFSAAWITSLEVYNLLQWENCGAVPVS